MNDHSIRSALDRIDPLPGAKQRMWQHLAEKRERKSRTPALWLLPLAACLLLVLWAAWPADRMPPDRGNVMAGNPLVQAAGPEDLAPAGLVPRLPEEAELTGCTLISGQIARMEFTLDGVRYACLSSAVRSDDFTFVSGKEMTAQQLSETPPVRLVRIDDAIWKAEIELETGRIYLLNFEGADRTQMEQLALALAGI